MTAFDWNRSQERARLRFTRARSHRQDEAIATARPERILRFALKGLPREVRESLYNLEAEANGAREVPGDQLAFYCFNYGSPRAISFAAGLPKICLERALSMPGFRPKSRSLLAAVLDYRKDR